MILNAYTSKSELIDYCELAHEYRVERVALAPDAFVRVAGLAMGGVKTGSAVFMGIKFVQNNNHIPQSAIAAARRTEDLPF